MLKQPTQSHCCRNCKYVILFYSKDAAKIQLFLNITTFCKNYYANHHSFTTARRQSAPWWRFRKNDSYDSSVTTLQNPVFFFLGFIAIYRKNRMILPPLTLPYTSLSRLRLDTSITLSYYSLNGYFQYPFTISSTFYLTFFFLYNYPLFFTL